MRHAAAFFGHFLVFIIFPQQLEKLGISANQSLGWLETGTRFGKVPHKGSVVPHKGSRQRLNIKVLRFGALCLCKC